MRRLVKAEGKEQNGDLKQDENEMKIHVDCAQPWSVQSAPTLPNLMVARSVLPTLSIGSIGVIVR